MPQEPIEKIRPLLGRYGCTGAQQNQVMNQLSAGQKARIVFAIIAFEKPHLLMLDGRYLLKVYVPSNLQPQNQRIRWTFRQSTL